MLQSIFIRKYVYKNIYVHLHSISFIHIHSNSPLSERHFVRVVGFMQFLKIFLVTFDRNCLQYIVFAS